MGASGHTSGRRVREDLREEEVVPDDWPPRATCRISTLAWQQPLPLGRQCVIVISTPR